MTTLLSKDKILQQYRIEIEDLYKKIKSTPSFFPDECSSLALEILDKRALVEDFYKNSKTGLFVDEYSDKEFRALGECRKFLYKAQSQLIKKTPSLHGEEFDAIEHSIQSVWKSSVSPPPKVPEFGKRFLLQNKKSSTTLLGVCQHQRKHSLVNFRSALLLLQDGQLILSSFTKLSLRDQKNIHQNFCAFFPKAITVEEFEKILGSCAKIPLLIEALTMTEENIISSPALSAPKKLLTLLPDQYQVYSYCMNSEEFRNWSSIKIKKKYHIDLSDPQDWRRFFILNFQSRSITGLFTEYSLEKFASLEKTLTGQPDWQAVKEQCLELPDPLLSEFETFIFSTSAQAKFVTSKTNVRSEGRKLIENYLQTKQHAPLIQSLHFLSDIFQTSLQHLTKLKEIPPNLDFKQPIVAIVTILSPDDKKDLETQNIVALAQETLCVITDKIPFSANYLNRENTPITLDKLSQIGLIGVLDNLDTYRKKVIHQEVDIFKLQKFPLSDFFIDSIYVHKNNEKYPLENCQALSQNAFIHILKQKTFTGRVEIFKLMTNVKNAIADHLFVVLNRAEKSNPKDYTTWGKAVIFDPWARRIYPAALMEQIMNNYLSKVEFSKKGFPKLERFDPNRHYCMRYAYNMATLDDFIETEPLAIPEIKEPLNAFHATNDRENKEVLAVKMLEILSNYKLSDKEPVYMRIQHQLQFFLNGKISLASNPDII